MIWFRLPTVVILVVVVLLPFGVVVYQSFLDEPLYAPAARFALSSYQFILGEPDFARAFVTTLALAAGMTAIAVPLGAALAFLVVRTDLPGKGVIEAALLVPIVLSPIVTRVRLRGRRGPGRVSLAGRQAADRRGALGALFADQPDRHCRPHPCPARLSVFVDQPAQAQPGARGAGPRPGRVAVAGRADRQPAAGMAGAGLQRGADVLSGLRAVRAAADHRRCGQRAGADHLSVQADQHLWARRRII